MRESTPATGLDAALALIAAGVPVGPAGRRSKRPILEEWQTPGRGSTLDPDTARLWWGPGGLYEGCGVTAVLRYPGLLALDPDTPEATAALAELAGGADGWPPTFVVLSAHGVKVIYPRPEDLAGRNGAHVNRPELGGADLLCNNILAWAPDRRWFGSPADIAPTRPEWLDAALDEITAPVLIAVERRAASYGADLRARVVELERGAAYLAVVIEGQAGRLAGLASGTGRPVILHSAACHIGARLWMAPTLEADARAELYAAAVGAGVAADYGERSTWGHIDRGLAWGKAHPAPAPIDRRLEDRADWTPGAVDPSGHDLQDLAPNAAAEVERTRAAARARLDRLDQDLDAIAPGFFTIHCVSSTGREFTRPNTQRRETTRLAATRILERAENTARSTFTYGASELAKAIGRGRASLIGAGTALAALGITSTPGRIGAEGLPIGRRWSVAGLDPESSANTDTCPGAAPGLAGGERDNVKCRPLPMIIQHSETGGAGDVGDVHISRANEAAGELCRGARSRRGDPAPPVERLVVDEETGLVEEKIVALGPTSHLVLDALRRLSTEGAEADVETVAEVAGVSLRTAGETLRRAHVLGIVTSSTAPTGKAGGQRKLWALVTTPTAAVLAVVARGKWVIERAARRARKAWESFTHTLQKRVKETGRAAAAVGAELAAEFKRRAVGERAASKPGGERGRADLGRSEWIGAVKRQAAALVTASTPPEWAAGLLPLGTFADDWSADPDPVIAFAVGKLGAVIV